MPSTYYSTEHSYPSTSYVYDSSPYYYTPSVSYAALSITAGLSSIFNAAQNWNDNMQTVLPGYRDRIVTVFLDRDEGGLNLDMPADVLERLRKRGTAAGERIAGRLLAPSLLDPDQVGMNWENHRWLRLRSTLGALRSDLAAIARAYRGPQAPDVAYDRLILASAGTPVEHFPIEESMRPAVCHLVKRIAELGEIVDRIETLEHGLPKPLPNLAMRASLDS